MSGDREVFVALALSGGGARAMAFHLGCLRALHDRRILAKVKVLSTVSGGSVIGATWAYRDGTFDTFDAEVVSMLRRGLQWEILRAVFFSWEGPKLLATLVVSGSLSAVLGLIRLAVSRTRRWLGVASALTENALATVSRHLPIWGSLTTAFEAALERKLFGKRTLNEVARPDLVAIINTCDLRTGT